MYSSFRCFLFFFIISNPRSVSILAQSIGEFKEDVSVCHTPHLPLSTPEGRGSWVGGSGVGGREWPGVRAAPEKAEESGSRHRS